MALDEWRIDAWAVRDGAAFASRRAAQSRVAANTIFVAMPDLEPVPVGRLSTALAATRRNFQAGLYGEDGEEIVFTSVDQVVELVRRGFLASGLGPGGSAAPAPSGFPPSGDSGGELRFAARDLGSRSEGGAYFEDAIQKTLPLKWRNSDVSVQLALESLAKLVRAPGNKVSFQLQALIVAYAEATTIDWEQRVGSQEAPIDVQMLLDWYHALHELGIWASDKSFSGFVHDRNCYWGKRIWGGWPSPFWTRHAEIRAFRRQLISYAPCPRRATWTVGLSRLADKLTLPMSVGNYFDANPDLPELAPATLAAMILTSSNFPSAIMSGNRYFGNRIEAALRWLSIETPSIELPERAELLVNNYAWSCLEGAGTGRSGPAWAPIAQPV